VRRHRSICTRWKTRCSSAKGEGLAILGDATFTVRAPATVLSPPGVKHGFINNSSAPMVVSGNFPALDVETTTVS
jgi:quercetin dioxygenase-like cupin family protein